MERTHASFFSGVGGLDLGLERAGWRTVSFSEIDAYASADLVQRWPGVPNLGDITALVRDLGSEDDRRPRLSPGVHQRQGDADGDGLRAADDLPWHRATLWSGGFPCQDISKAGKRLGLAGERSGLAFAFLDLVERYRPPWILLENVEELLRSNAGLDLGALASRLEELGYGWAYRVLDAQFAGVAQRRERVFLVAGPSTECAASVLLDPESVSGSPEASREERPRPRSRFADGIGGDGIVPQAISAKWAKGSAGPAGDKHHNLIVGPLLSKSSGGGWRIGGDEAGANHIIAATLTAGADGRAGRRHEDDYNLTPAVVPGPPTDADRMRAADGMAGRLDRRGGMEAGPDLDPLGLDTNRYRCIGNGVVAPVAEWIGHQLIRVIREREEIAA